MYRIVTFIGEVAGSQQVSQFSVVKRFGWEGCYSKQEIRSDLKFAFVHSKILSTRQIKLLTLHRVYKLQLSLRQVS
jgi:hypothetical protein